MKRFSYLTISLLILVSQTAAYADSRFTDIREVVQKYLVGTAHGSPELVSEAFLRSLEV